LPPCHSPEATQRTVARTHTPQDWESRFWNDDDVDDDNDDDTDDDDLSSGLIGRGRIAIPGMGGRSVGAREKEKERRERERGRERVGTAATLSAAE